MILLGIIFLVLGLVMFFLRPQLSEQNVFEGGELITKKAPPFLLMFSKKISLAIAAVGVFIMLLPSLFFWSQPGYQYLLVYPTGKTSAVMTQGIKFRGFAKIVPWQKYIDIKAVRKSDKNLEELEGVMSPIPIRFIDQVTAHVVISGRFQLPTTEEDFVNLAIKYRTMNNLVNNTLIPTIKEQANNTGYMFAAQDYISGEAQKFRQTLDEQLKDGAYAVKKIEYKDTVFSDVQSENREIREIRTSYTVERVLDGLKPKRIAHELTENNIIVSQVIVDDVILEPTFRKRLEKQRDESAKRQIEQQQVETAKAAQSRIIAEGERDKAAERVSEERNQVKQLIAIETKLKLERTNKELAAIALQTERLNAQQKKVAAEAKAYENAKLVSAGLTPQERAEWEYKTAVGVAGEIAKIKFPETMITGGSSKQGTPLESLIGAAMAKQLTDAHANNTTKF